jgi:hypothetical protein
MQPEKPKTDRELYLEDLDRCGNALIDEIQRRAILELFGIPPEMLDAKERTHV